MFVGPVFTREMVTAARRSRLYLVRTTYVLALWLLACTAWLVLTGTQNVRNLGDLARFGGALFNLLAPLQLAIVLMASAIIAATTVSQEKDRKTFLSLLVTSLTDSELVLGKLLASLLIVLVMIVAAVPWLLLLALLGGVSVEQIARVTVVTMASSLVAGSLGNMLACWREKTFQTLALTALALVAWLTFWEIVASGLLGTVWSGIPTTHWATCLSPWQAVLAAARPALSALAPATWWEDSFAAYLVFSLVAAIGMNGWTIFNLRRWNPSREVRRRPAVLQTSESIFESALSDAEQPTVSSAGRAPGQARRVWRYPVLWREVCTWAYGRKLLAIRAGYLILWAAAAVLLHNTLQAGPSAAGRVIPPAAESLAPLFVLSLVFLNALAVTSVTHERDGRSLDLLLVTDITPKEFVFGKLGGVFYNTKEMVLLPAVLCLYLWSQGGISGENLIYLIGGLMVMNLFTATLGIHIGLNYGNSKSAIAASLGTLLFLFLGIATCMRMMIAFAGSFQTQLQPFLAFMLGGGVGLYVTLGLRNPSRAIAIASFGAPLATFYAITSFILGAPLAVFLVVVVTYGFATTAMLVPALHEFNVASGRGGGENSE